MCCIINFFKKRKESIAEKTKAVTIRDRSATQTESTQAYNCRRFVI
jgi:hypothetical protein